MSNLLPRDIKKIIVDYLDKNGISTIKEIVNKTKISRHTIQYHLNNFVDNKMVYRITISNTYHYYIDNFYNINTNDLPEDIKIAFNKLIDKLILILNANKSKK
ncbi:MAG: hypothetical protein ACFFAO_02155 [Candidatus Hermodarchaeota archaeon]